MNWNELLEKWESGNYFSFPSNLKGKFQWNTSVLKNKGKSKYLEEFMVKSMLSHSKEHGLASKIGKKWDLASSEVEENSEDLARYVVEGIIQIIYN